MSVQEHDEGSTLSLYRRALALRRELQTAEELTWIETGRADVLRFRRPGGWEVATNFGTEPYALDGGRESGGDDGFDGDGVLVTSSSAAAGIVPAETTVWLRRARVRA